MENCVQGSFIGSTKDTSGLLMVAKDQAHVALAEELKDKISPEVLNIVHGNLPNDRGHDHTTQ